MKLIYRGAVYQSESAVETSKSTLSGKYRGTEITFAASVAQPTNMVLRYRGLHYMA